MKLITAVAALILLAAPPAMAATFHYDFYWDTSQMYYGVCNRIRDYTPAVMRGGITATFGEDFSFGADCDDAPNCPCPFEIEARALNNYANEPSAPGVGAMCVAADSGPLGSIITFDPPIRYLGVWVSWTANTRLYLEEDCSSWGEIVTTAYLRMYRTPNTFPTVAAIQLTESTAQWDIGCLGDPSGDYCGWRYYELVVPPAEAPVSYVEIGAGIRPLYLDDMTASTEPVISQDPIPPQELRARASDDMPRPPVTRRASWGRVKTLYR